MPKPIPLTDVDDMSLGELIDLAQDTLAHYSVWSEWLEDYYDPAKSALVSLLQWKDVIESDG